MIRPAHQNLRNPVRPSPLAVAILLVFVMSVGCAGPSVTPRERDPLVDAPGWVTRGCRVYWQVQRLEDRVVCGIGTAGPDRNLLAARETAIARARSAIARSIEVTIESLVRLESSPIAANDGALRSIVHQLTSTSLPASRVESIWSAESGEVFALVSLRVAKLEQSLRQNRRLSPVAREELARRAASAFASMNAALDAESDEPEPASGWENGK